MNETDTRHDDNDSRHDTSDPRPGWRKRIARFAWRGLKLVIVLLAVVGVFNIVMYRRAQAEAARIADTKYGGAFESVDYRGRGDAGVLLFHGIHGTPRNLQILTTRLQERRTHYYAPMLGGDRPSPAAGLGFTATSLATEAENAYAILKRRCKRIVVVGHSLGAVQATDVASRHPVAGLVVISPAYRITQRWYIQPSMEAWTTALTPLAPLLPKFAVARINDPSGLANCTGLMTFPLQAVNALVDYSGEVLARSDKVQAPVLGLLSSSDSVVDVGAAEAGIQSLASPAKRVVWYTRSDHMLLLDYDREEATREVMDFIAAQLRDPSVSP